MKKLNYKSGFTLIELLVVVAIIGMLATIILVALNNARSKGADASIKTNLANARAQAAILYDKWGYYGIDATPAYINPVAQCANTAHTIYADPNIWGMVTAAFNAGSGAASSACFSSSSLWAAAVQLKSSDGAGAANPKPDSWCTDSGGASKSYVWATGEVITDSITAGGVCK